MTTGESELRPMPASNEMSPYLSAQPLCADSASIQSSDNSTFANSNTNPKISSSLSSANTPNVRLSPTGFCQDPNYNPRFVNDMPTPVRKGWDSAIHFMTKHSDGLTKAAKSYVTSHLEFGGCLADYKGLKDRYSRLRSLHDIEPHQSNHAPRVRFVNYYTASTGRPKKVKPPPPSERNAQLSQWNCSEETIERELQGLHLSNHGSSSLPGVPCISIEERRGNETTLKTSQDTDERTSVASSGCSPGDTPVSEAAPEMVLLDATPATDNESDDTTVEHNEKNGQLAADILCSSTSTVSPPFKEDKSGTHSQVEEGTPFLLPPLPPSPKQPPAFNPSSYADKDARNLAQIEYSRQNKSYMQALKDYGKAIKDREKLIEKKKKAARKVSEKATKLNQKEILKAKRDDVKPEFLPAPSASNSAILLGGEHPLEGSIDDKRVTGSESNKRMRDKKFCMLPPKINDQIDPCWVRVFMRDVDEVGAHCGLFFLGDQYKWLVSDVGNRIKEWVQER